MEGKSLKPSFSKNSYPGKRPVRGPDLSELFAPVAQRSGVPPYIQIAERIREAIQSGLLQPNDQLPSEKNLAETFHVSRTTVRAALDTLAEEGRIYKVHGVGTFVAEPRPEGAPNRLRGFYEEMTSAGHLVTSNILSATEEEADDETAEALRIEKGELVYKIERLRYVDAEPMVLSYEHIPAALVPELLTDLSSGHIESLYAYLDRKGLCTRRALLQYSATTVPERISNLLYIQRQAPVLLEKRISMTIDNKPILFSLSYFRADRYTSVVELER